MFQQILFQKIKKSLPENQSLNEAIAMALDIGYDAAHRRTSDKSKLSFEEGVVLARYFNLSIDGLFENTSKNIVAVEKILAGSSEKDLEDYYRASISSLKPLASKENVEFLYSAKDIPIFYVLENKVLGKFKAYVWLKLLNENFKDVTYEEYRPKESLLDTGLELSRMYDDIRTVEIWDVTTINSLLKQIHFYFKAQQISYESAIELLTNLKDLICKVEKRLKDKDQNYLLYYNELILMGNTVLVKVGYMKSLYVPFTTLSYYVTKDEVTCKVAEKNFKKELNSSKLLNTAGEMEQKSFFNKIYSKIEVLTNLVSTNTNFEFE